MSKPFLIFPWQRSFLKDLKDRIEADTGGRPGSALIITPHKRPWRYLANMYAMDCKPAILPKMMTFSEVVAVWNAGSEESGRYVANSLDQAMAMRQCVNDTAAHDPRLAARFSQMDMEVFLPWGLRLAALLEELFSHGIEAADIAYAENEVSPQAAGLLSALGRISRNWQRMLASLKWTTPGLSCFYAKKRFQEIPPLLLPSDSRHVYIAGFYALNGAQEKLFRSLWQAGASVCLHTDPAVAGEEVINSHCREHIAWLRRWRAKSVLAVDPLEQEPAVSFFAGYDLHSQLLQLESILSRPGAESAGQSTAVILPHPGILLPTIHHTGQNDINISMGYPLSRTLMHDFLENVMALAAKNRRGYYWKDLRNLFRNLAMLLRECQTQTLRDSLARLIQLISSGPKFVNPDTLLPQISTLVDASQQDFIKKCFSILLDQPARVATMAEMAASFQAILQLLLDYGGESLEHDPMDAEAISRVQATVIPVLRNNAMADETLPLPLLHGIAHELLAKERIPFEADPLVGTQILGLLETRMLHFDRVFFLDATDDVMPGDSAHDPLLPDSLRGLIGLPDARSRESVMAHNLFRLCAGAKEAHFLWQEGVGRSAMFDSKKLRSRFVEQLIWREEQKQGRQIGNDANMTALVNLHAPVIGHRNVQLSTHLASRLKKFFASGLSPSSLDSYLACPARFAYGHLLGLTSPCEINEGDDPPLVGEFIHMVLREIYLPFRGQEKSVDAGFISPDKVEQIFMAKLEEMEIAKKLPLESYFMLQEAGLGAINKLISLQAPARIIDLEKDIHSYLDLGLHRYRFHARIDRLDMRDGKFYILDYKTGKVKKGDPDLWTDDGFLGRLAPYARGEKAFDDDADNLLAELGSRLPSLQLPCYMVMLRNTGCHVANAAYVDLRESCEEIPLLGDGGNPEDNLDRAKTVIGFVAAHLGSRQCFPAAPGSQCKWCEFSGLCTS